MSVIKAGTTLTTAYTVEADTTGALEFKTGPSATLAMSISASGVVTFPATTGFDIASANITNLTSSTATISNTLALSGGTANGMLYLNGSKVVTSGSAVVFNGTNMGIGGTPSSWQSGRTVLQITPSSTQGHLAFGGVISNISTNAFVDSTPAWKYIANGIPALYQQDEGRHFWYTAASGTAGNTISWTQAMTLGGNGNLAIGATNTTVAKLYVVGSGNANSIMTSTAAALTGSANAVWIGDDGTDALIGPGNSGSSLSFLSRAGGVYTKAMTLDASGNLSLGFTGGATRLGVRGPMYVPAAGFKELGSFFGTDSQATGNGGGITLGGVYTGTAVTSFAQVAGLKENSTDNNYAGYLAFYSRPNGDTLIERARFNSTGAFVLAGGTTTANGIGITFPATQSASSNANTLDDYEEGTWTPTGNNITFSSAAGKYTKVGDTVTVWWELVFPTTSSTDDATINGLPFTVASSTWSGALAITNVGIADVLAFAHTLRTDIWHRNSSNSSYTNANFSGKFSYGCATYKV